MNDAEQRARIMIQIMYRSWMRYGDRQETTMRTLSYVISGQVYYAPRWRGMSESA
jgi:hypothetical protein